MMTFKKRSRISMVYWCWYEPNGLVLCMVSSEMSEGGAGVYFVGHGVGSKGRQMTVLSCYVQGRVVALEVGS